MKMRKIRDLRVFAGRLGVSIMVAELALVLADRRYRVAVHARTGDPHRLSRDRGDRAANARAWYADDKNCKSELRKLACEHGFVVEFGSGLYPSFEKDGFPVFPPNGK